MVMFFDPVLARQSYVFFLKQYINLYKSHLFWLSSSVPPRFLNALPCKPNGGLVHGDFGLLESHFLSSHGNLGW